MTTETIGFIGLGVMGRPMARNLLKRGFPLVVHSRSRGPVDEIVSAGARAARSPADVAAQATRIITMLPDGPDVEQVLAGTDGVFQSLQKDSVLIDMSTIAPATARRLAQEAATRGATLLDAPVSGGEIGAIDGTLTHDPTYNFNQAAARSHYIPQCAMTVERTSEHVDANGYFDGLKRYTPPVADCACFFETYAHPQGTVPSGCTQCSAEKACPSGSPLSACVDGFCVQPTGTTR